MSNFASPRVLPPFATASAISSSRAPWIALASAREQRAALGERQLAELARAGLARVARTRREVVAAGTNLGERLLGRGVDERCCAIPFRCDQAPAR